MNNYITLDPNILVGKPIIKGTRIPVTLILNLIAHGRTVDDILEDYPNLTKPAVIAAVKYAEDQINREEIHLTETK